MYTLLKIDDADQTGFFVGFATSKIADEVYKEIISSAHGMFRKEELQKILDNAWDIEDATIKSNNSNPLYILKVKDVRNAFDNKGYYWRKEDVQEIMKQTNEPYKVYVAKDNKWL